MAAVEGIVRRSRKALAAVAFALAFVVAACAPAPEADPADTIFFGDHIITMDPRQPNVEAVAVRGETIVAAGPRDEVMALEGPSTRVVDLREHALLPGFIDSHGHFLGAGRDQTSLLLHPPPVGDVSNIDDIVRKVREWIDEHDIPPGEPVTGRGYDDSLLEEGRHPTREDLDRASTEHPIVLTHVSGHLTTTNSAALAASDITAETPDPPGGHVRRIEGSLEPNGVLEETASGLLAIERAPAPSAEEFDDLIRRSIDVYLSHGTTTIQDGGTSPAQAERFRAAAEREPFKADVAAFVRRRGAPGEVADVSYAREYRNGFRVGGVKLMLDGSPQGRTAWVTIPYEERPPNTPPDYVAYGVMDPDEYKAQADQLIRAGIPILVHANGDAAMDLMMDGVDEAVADHGSHARPPLRHHPRTAHARRPAGPRRRAERRTLVLRGARLLLGRLAPAQLRRGAGQQHQPGGLGARTGGGIHRPQRRPRGPAAHHATGIDHRESQDPQRTYPRTAPAADGDAGPACRYARRRLPVLRGRHQGLDHGRQASRSRHSGREPAHRGSGDSGVHSDPRDVLQGQVGIREIDGAIARVPAGGRAAACAGGRAGPFG